MQMDTIFLYLDKREKNFMDKKNNKKTTTATTGQEKKIDRIKRKANEWSGVFTIAAFILAFLAVPVAAGKWIERLNNVEERVGELSQWNTSIGEVQKSVASMQTSITNIAERVDRIETHEDNILSLKLSENAKIDVEPVGSSELHFASWEGIEDNAVVGTDDENNSYTIKDIAGKTIFIPYRNQDKVLLFYGQLSNKQNWDGLCLLNVYCDNRLQFVSEAQFEDGRPISYKQVFWDDENSAWYCSERQVYDSGNYGYTKKYDTNFEYTLDKTVDKIQVMDFIDCSYVLGKIDENLSGVYWGYTSESLYNDQTGNAYLVKYDKEGNVDYLYRGRFSNGQPNDMTGKAWMIGQNKYGKYLFYQGKFENDNKIDDSSHWEQLNDKREINKKIEKYDFQCDLKWRDF